MGPVRTAGVDVSNAADAAADTAQSVKTDVGNLSAWAANLMQAVWLNGVHLELHATKLPMLGSLVIDVTIPHPETKP